MVDLYHDLPVIVDKAERHALMERLGPDSDEMKRIDNKDFIGMTQKAIDEERTEYVIPSQSMMAQVELIT